MLIYEQLPKTIDERVDTSNQHVASLCGTGTCHTTGGDCFQRLWISVGVAIAFGQQVL